MKISRSSLERRFLIDMAVLHFNRQYGRAIDPKLCGIKSIRTNYGCSHGYEIRTFQEDDHLRLRFYFTLADREVFDPYRLEVDERFVRDAIGDEVYVMIGTIPISYVENDIYRFRPIAEIIDEGSYVLYLEGDYFQFMSGERMTWVNT